MLDPGVQPAILELQPRCLPPELPSSWLTVLKRLSGCSFQNSRVTAQNARVAHKIVVASVVFQPHTSKGSACLL